MSNKQQMTRTQLQVRFDYLGTALELSRGNFGYFSAGQRICLHMERSAIFSAIDLIDLGDNDTAEPKYSIPLPLEKKCKQVYKDFQGDPSKWIHENIIKQNN